MANKTDQQKEEGASQFQQQKKIIGDLLSSAENGDLELLQKTVESIQVMGVTSVEEILTDFKDANKRTALHFAAARGRRKVLNYILEHAPGCVNVQDEQGWTPLYCAAKENEFVAVKLLLAAGADANVVTSAGASPLHEAAANGSIRTCRLLMEHTANLEAMTPNGTALHFAVSENREKTVEALLQLGAQINVTNAKGVTPLMLSCLMNKPVVARELLSANADVAITIMGGITALHIAAETGFTDVVKEFLSLRKEDTIQVANMKSDAGATPLQLAAGMGHRAIVELLMPLTKGFEDANIETLMDKEKEALEAYYKEAKEKEQLKKEQKQDDKDSNGDDGQGQSIDGIVPEDEIEVPESKPVDEATLARANELKEEGNKAYISKEYQRAVELYSEALALNPSDPFLYSNRCAAYLGAGEAKKALHDVRISKKLKPRWAKALFREGQCLEALKLYEEAACAMWAAIQLAPEDKLLKKRFQDCVARGRSDHQAKQKKTP